MVTQFKFSALITANNTLRTTEGPPIPEGVVPDRNLEDEELKALLATEVKKKKKNKKKKKGGGGGDADAEEAD